MENRNYFPRLYSSGVESGRMFMIMDLLGPNLADLMTLCGGKFSIKTSILLTIQIVFLVLDRFKELKHCMKWDLSIEISNLKTF